MAIIVMKREGQIPEGFCAVQARNGYVICYKPNSRITDLRDDMKINQQKHAQAWMKGTECNDNYAIPARDGVLEIRRTKKGLKY